MQNVSVESQISEGEEKFSVSRRVEGLKLWDKKRESWVNSNTEKGIWKGEKRGLKMSNSSCEGDEGETKT